MLEMKITITAPDLAAAIVSLANALEGKGQATPATAQPKQATAPVAQPTITTPTVNPTQAPGAPLIATPAQTVAPVANPAPVAPYTAPVTPVAAPVATTVTPAPTAPVVPTSAPTYTLEMIAAAGSSLIDAGKLDALMALLGKYGVDSLTNLAPEHYGAIAMELRTLGARL